MKTSTDALREADYETNKAAAKWFMIPQTLCDHISILWQPIFIFFVFYTISVECVDHFLHIRN